MAAEPGPAAGPLIDAAPRVSGRPLAGRVAVVTGGGRGIGRRIVLHLAARGAHVVVNNRNRIVDDDGRGAADHVVAEVEAMGAHAVAEHGDVVDPATAERLAALALDRWGRLDICVTSAGVSGAALFHRVNAEDFAAVIRINLLGSAQVAARCARVMREAGYGRIVLISSGAGLHGEPTVPAYAASKGALVALGRTIAREGAAKGVQTTVLLPYGTTQMTDGMPEGVRTLMDPDRIGPVVAALVDERCTLNGEVIVTGGGAVRATDTVEWDTVRLPHDEVTPEELEAGLVRSRAGRPRTYATAYEAFSELAAEIGS